MLLKKSHYSLLSYPISNNLMSYSNNLMSYSSSEKKAMLLIPPVPLL